MTEGKILYPLKLTLVAIRGKPIINMFISHDMRTVDGNISILDPRVIVMNAIRPDLLDIPYVHKKVRVNERWIFSEVMPGWLMFKNYEFIIVFPKMSVVNYEERCIKI